MNLFDPLSSCKLFNLAQKAKILSIIKSDRIIDLLTFLPKKSTEIIMANNYLDILNQYFRYKDKYETVFANDFDINSEETILYCCPT